MRHFITSMLLIFCVPICTSAQDKNLDLEQIILHSSTVSPRKLPQLCWIPGTNDISYIDTLNGQQFLFKQEFDSRNRTVIVSGNTISEKLTAIGEDKFSRFP